MTIVNNLRMTGKQHFPAFPDPGSPMKFQFVKRIKIADEEPSIIQAHGNAVLTMSRRPQDLSVNPKLRQKGPAVMHIYNADLAFIDRMMIFVRLSAKNTVGSMHILRLQVHHSDPRPAIRDLLGNAAMIRMIMRDQNIGNILDRDALLSHFPAEVPEGTRPAGVEQEQADPSSDQICICRSVV